MTDPVPALAPAPARAKLDVVDALAAAFGGAFRHFAPLLATQGVFVILGGVVSLALTLLLVPEFTEIFTLLMAGGAPLDILVALAPVFALALASGLVGFLISAIGSAGGIVTADALDRGERIGLAEAWRRARPRLANYILTTLLGLAIALGLLLASAMLIFLVFPILVALVVVLYLIVRWFVAGPVSLLETRSVTGNLTRASEITAGSRGAIFGVLLLLLILGIVSSAIVSFTTSGGTTFSGQDPRDAMETLTPATIVLRSVLGTAVNLVVAFVTTILIVHVYRKLVPNASSE